MSHLPVLAGFFQKMVLLHIATAAVVTSAESNTLAVEVV